MTDTSIADKVYMEPLTLEYIAKIILYERPDAILPGIGGQTGLNLAMQLEKKVFLQSVVENFLGQKAVPLNVRKTEKCLRSSARVLVNRYYLPILQALWKKVCR